MSTHELDRLELAEWDEAFRAATGKYVIQDPGGDLMALKPALVPCYDMSGGVRWLELPPASYLVDQLTRPHYFVSTEELPSC